MSETSSANAGKKLLLETSQGQVEIAFLPELAPNHVNRIAELASSGFYDGCLLYTSPSPRDGLLSRMPSSA